ncbi:MAG: hypothetical protein R2838_09890 [Caldilineaceae bacterium]
MTGGPAITTTQLAFIGNGSVLGVPYPVIFFILIAAAFAVILNRTVFGFNVYMLGTNPTAALFSGINIDRVLIRTYWLAGMVAGVAGIIFLAQFGQAHYGAPSSCSPRSSPSSAASAYRRRGHRLWPRSLGAEHPVSLHRPQHAHAGTLRLQRRHLLPPVRLGRAAAPGHGAQLLRRET